MLMLMSAALTISRGGYHVLKMFVTPYLRPYGLAYICYGNTCEKKHVTEVTGHIHGSQS